MMTTVLRERLAMLTAPEAAAELNISIGELCELLESGKLPCLRLGDHGERVRIIRCVLQAYQRQLTATAVSGERR